MRQAHLVRVNFRTGTARRLAVGQRLVEQILDDVGHEPITHALSHALLETWERRRGVVA